jgi:hypothetical protein
MANSNPSRAPGRQRRKGKSTVRHTRAIQRDRTKRPTSAPLAETVEQHLTELIHPATLAQLDLYRQLGLRERLLTLPVMVALVLVMIWRQIGSVGELVRLLRSEGFLWNAPVPVSQQALSERLRVFPAVLFQRVLEDVLPAMHARAQQRQRPVPPAVAWAQAHYPQVVAGDGSTLDALVRKVGLLRDAPKPPLAGRIFVLIDLASRLPRQVTYTEKATAHDQGFWPPLLAGVPAGALLVLDAGFTHFANFLKLTAAQVTFIIRAKSNLAWTVARSLQRTPRLRDTLVWIGQGTQRQQVRLVEILVGPTWYRYLTNELDPDRLPAALVGALYAQRWRIEDAFALAKRLLGLAYFWVGAQNGVQLQVGATFLLYCVLIDLTDAVAEALQRPLSDLSVEMVYRSLYYFTQAYHRGEATDVIAYLATNAGWLGIIKRPRTNKSPAAQPAGPT